MSASILLAVVALMVVNQLAMRMGAVGARKAIFWSLQVANLALGTAVIAIGLPDLPRVVSWFIGLSFFYRVVINNQARVEHLREEREAGRSA